MSPVIMVLDDSNQLRYGGSFKSVVATPSVYVLLYCHAAGFFHFTNLLTAPLATVFASAAYSGTNSGSRRNVRRIVGTPFCVLTRASSGKRCSVQALVSRPPRLTWGGS